MGREIVYCWKCAKRVDGDDFAELKAYRYGDKVSCDECVFDLVGDLPAEEQEAILNGTASRPKAKPAPDAPRRGTTTRVTTTRTGQTGKVPTTRGTGKIPTADGTRSIPRKGMSRPIPKVEAPPEEGQAVEGELDQAAAAKKKKLILIGAGGGGLLLVVVVLLVVLMGGKKKAPPPPAEVARTEVKKTELKPSKEETAKKALDAAMAVFRDKPDDLGAKFAALREAELLSPGTTVDDEVKKQLEVLQIAINKELGAVKSEVGALTPAYKFKEAFAALDKALTKHDFPEWRTDVEKIIASTKGIVEDKFLTEKKAAVEAKDAGETAKVDAIVAKVKAWEIPELVERLTKDLGAVAAAPPDAPAAPDATPKTPASAAKKPRREAKPLSKDLQAYQPVWEKAAGLAFQRDYDGAMTEIRRGVKELDSDEARKESTVDLELLEQAKTWVEETAKLLAQTKRLESLSIDIHDKPGEFKNVTGRVSKVFEQRFEFRVMLEKDGKKIPSSLFVEYADVAGRSLGELARKLRGGKLAPADARMAALVCLLEGNDDAATSLGGKDAESLPDRYWLHAPNAKEKAPKSNGKEFEARNLYHQAELEFADIQTRGAALEKYKTLNNEYSTARITQRNQATILKRGLEGKEYEFNARTFKTEGVFKPARKPDLVLQATKEVDGPEMKDNYVEAEFYALPGLTYRCWALLGGCCKETFDCYLQTSEATTTNAGKQASIDPGGNMAVPLAMQISGLKKDHAAHAPKDKKAAHPKDAVRWEWVPVPLAKSYAAPGAKAVRLLTGTSGFAVKFIVISSTRTKTPDEKETAELVRKLNEEPAKDDSGVKGTPEPKEWLLAGPFDESLNKVNPPEREIDLAKEMTGKSNKKFKWKLGAAPLQGGYVLFNWEDGKTFNPKDNVSGYALIHVKAPAPMPVLVSVGHDDGGKVWVNGEVVHSNDRGGGVKNDEFKAKASLEEGWNAVLVKVRTASGGFGLSFRILDDQGQPAAGLEYSPYGEMIPP